MEKLIESHPWVKGALVVGQGRFQTGLLIEPQRSQASTTDSSTLVDHIWPMVEQANHDAPAHARISWTMIVVAEEQKPFRRTPKGSIVRHQTAAEFEYEIKALYAAEEYSSNLNQNSNGGVELKSKIHAVFRRALRSFVKYTPDAVDIFNLGVDSLYVLVLTNDRRTPSRSTSIQ
jgi:hypothetical protein